MSALLFWIRAAVEIALDAIGDLAFYAFVVFVLVMVVFAVWLLTAAVVDLVGVL